MCSNPGCLPKNYKQLDINKMNNSAQKLYEKAAIAYDEIQQK